jgi:hypothetical protein
MAQCTGERRLRIDIRTPGLADQFEQTAARDKALLLGTIATFFDAVPPEKKTKFLYQSEVRLCLKCQEES